MTITTRLRGSASQRRRALVVSLAASPFAVPPHAAAQAAAKMRRIGCPYATSAAVGARNIQAFKLGGLLSYGASIEDMYRRAPRYVDRILKGANPAELAIEQPTKYEFGLNLKTARTLGLKIPQSPLVRAEEIIE